MSHDIVHHYTADNINNEERERLTEALQTLGHDPSFVKEVTVTEIAIYDYEPEGAPNA